MRWEKGRRSTHVEDRRGRSGGGRKAVGGIGGVGVVLELIVFCEPPPPSATTPCSATQGGA